MSTSRLTIAHLTPIPTYMNPPSINKTQSPGYHIQPQIVDGEIGEARGGEAGVDISLGGRRRVRTAFLGFTRIPYSSQSETDDQLLFAPSHLLLRCTIRQKQLEIPVKDANTQLGL